MAFKIPKLLPEATFDLPEVGARARIRGRIATDANKPYFNAMLRLGGKRIRAQVRSANLTTEMLERNRLDDAHLYPLHVITGWEGIEDEAGKEVPFSAEACEGFFKQLVSDAPWVFDRVRNFFASPESFVKDEDAPPDPAVVSGN